MLNALEKSPYDENLSQPLQTQNKQFKITIAYLTGYIGIFSVTFKNQKFILISVFEGVEYNVKTIPPSAYDLESLIKESKRCNTDEGYVTEKDYPFSIKPIFWFLGSIKEIKRSRGWQINFVPDDTLAQPLGFNLDLIHEEYIYPHSLVVI